MHSADIDDEEYLTNIKIDTMKSILEQQDKICGTCMDKWGTLKNLKTGKMECLNCGAKNIGQELFEMTCSGCHRLYHPATPKYLRVPQKGEWKSNPDCIGYCEDCVINILDDDRIDMSISNRINILYKYYHISVLMHAPRNHPIRSILEAIKAENKCA